MNFWRYHNTNQSTSGSDNLILLLQSAQVGRRIRAVVANTILIPNISPINHGLISMALYTFETLTVPSPRKPSKEWMVAKRSPSLTRGRRVRERRRGKGNGGTLNSSINELSNTPENTRKTPERSKVQVFFFFFLLLFDVFFSKKSFPDFFIFDLNCCTISCNISHKKLTC